MAALGPSAVAAIADVVTIIVLRDAISNALDNIYNNHSDNERALKDMLENDTKRGDPDHPLSKDDADAALELGDELDLDTRDHRSPEDAKHYTQDGKYPDGIPHIHIDGLSGKLRHIPACR